MSFDIRRVPGDVRYRLRRWFDERISNYAFRVDVRERWCRQEFFYNAFKALAFNGIDGDYLEFGCNGGVTFSMAHREAKRHGHTARFWAFDSFQGLPPARTERDEHPMWIESTLAMDLPSFHRQCAVNGIARDDYEVVPGFYEDSLPLIDKGSGPDSPALVYIDCDLYSSTRDVLEFLQPRLRHGMIIGFDDYHCWSKGQMSGERRAMLEVFDGRDQWSLVPFMRYGWAGESFLVESAALKP